jgi:hypothetical protein
VIQPKLFGCCFHFQALFYTGNQNVDLAASWLFENQDTQGLDEPLEVRTVNWMNLLNAYVTINRGPVCVRIQNIKHAL